MTVFRPAKRRIYAPLAALLLALVAWLAWDRFHGVLPAPADRQASGENGVPRQVYYGPPNSIAVLPFRSAGAVQEDAVLAEALASDILDLLTAAPGLQVTARSSSFYFRQRDADPRIIAELLQSRHLLMGEWTSRTDGVRLTLSLYDARGGREIWRNEYVAALPNLLEMRSALCDDVVAELPVPPIACGRPQAVPDASAWNRYAWGLRYAASSGEQDLSRAAEAFLSASEIDPGFTAARLELAGIWLHPLWNSAGQSGESVAAARGTVQAVLQKHPDSARAWRLLSFIRHRHDWDWEGAAEAGRRAVELRPGDAGTLGVASLAVSTLGSFEEALEYLAGSVRRDPFNLNSRLRLGLVQEFVGDYEAALATYRRILTMNADYPGAHAYRARIKLLQEKPESALRESEQEPDPFWGRYARILALSASGESEAAEPLLGAMVEEAGSDAAFQIAEILAFRGERQRAFEWLERAYLQQDLGMSSMIGNRFLENLHADPMWAEWLARLQLPAGEPPGG